MSPSATPPLSPVVRHQHGDASISSSTLLYHCVICIYLCSQVIHPAGLKTREESGRGITEKWVVVLVR